MPVNGPPKGLGPLPPTLNPGTTLRRATTTGAPPRVGATPRSPAFDAPPLRTNSLPATAGSRAPQGATLPPRRGNALPPARAGAWSPAAGMPQGLHAFPGMAPHPNAQVEQLKKMAEQVEATQKNAQELAGKALETANKAVDGIKDAVSPST